MSKLSFKALFKINTDQRSGFLMKCKYKLIGHTLLWVYWKLRYDQTSPSDLFRAKRASPRVKLLSPGRRTCEMDRPDIHKKGYSLWHNYCWKVVNWYNRWRVAPEIWPILRNFWHSPGDILHSPWHNHWKNHTLSGTHLVSKILPLD